MLARIVLCRVSLLVATAAIVCLAGCPSERETPGPGGVSPHQPPASPKGVEPAEIELTSSAFEPGGPIPAKYTEDGEDASPPLSWSGVPEGTNELALVCEDPDAPSPKRPNPDPWVHWVLYKIPADTESLPEGVAKTARLEDPPGALQGKNSWGRGQTIGYRGPAPPAGSGTHRYFFKLYALDSELEIEPEADKPALLEAIEGHVLGQGELFGTYER
jgi:Raf kinase inhibitor-like YbhB/YbcL family protein